MDKKERCSWVIKELDIIYHDTEWGVESHDDRYLFEMLILEGFQAGLSWSTILNKRENFRNVFDNFDYVKISNYNDDKLEELLQYEGIIRNRLKVYGTRTNAQKFIEIQVEFGSFDKYIWSFTNYTKVINKPREMNEVNATSELSDKISKDLKKRGFKFVGSTIIYAYLQAIGIVNDHLVTCFCKYK